MDTDVASPAVLPLSSSSVPEGEATWFERWTLSAEKMENA